MKGGKKGKRSLREGEGDKRSKNKGFSPGCCADDMELAVDTFSYFEVRRRRKREEEGGEEEEG